MMDISNPQGNTAKNKQGKPAQAGSAGYKSKLDEILAKAGSNNPIAAAQAKNNTPAQNAAAAATPAQPAPAPNPAPAANAAPAQAQPQDPNSRLQQILAMAGQTPAQRAQTQAQQSAANVTQILQNYITNLQANPCAILLVETDFSSGGAPEEISFKCYADSQGAIYWDLFGSDISYIVPSSISGNYMYYDDYYRGIPNDLIIQELTASRITSHSIV